MWTRGWGFSPLGGWLIGMWLMRVALGSWSTRELRQQPKAGFCHSLLISFLTGLTGCLTFPFRYESFWILSLYLLRTTAPKLSNYSCLLSVFQVWWLGLRILKISPLLPRPFPVVYHLHSSRRIWWWAIWVKTQWESGAREDGGQWFPSLWSPIFLWDRNILPSFIKERGEERESRSDWYCQGFFLVFFYSPTTSLLPPSESFRIEKRPFTGEDWRIRGEETEFAQTHKLFPSVSLFLIGYICEDRCTTVATRKIQNPRRLYWSRYTFLWALTIQSCQ